MSSLNKKFYLNHHRLRKLALAVTFISFFINLLILSVPLYSLQVFDRVLSSKSTDTLLALTLLIVLLVSVYALLDWSRSRLLSATALEWDNSLAGATFTASLKESSETGQPADSGLKHIDNIRTAIKSGAASFADLLWSPLIIITLVFLHPWYALLALAIATLLLCLAWINYKLTGSPKTSDISQLSNTLLSQAATVRALGMIKSTAACWEHVRQQTLNQQEGRTFINLQSVAKYTRLLGQVFIVGAGAYLFIQNELSVGAMIAGSMLFGRALGPFEQTVSNTRIWLNAAKSWLALRQAALADLEIHTPETALDHPRGQIRLEQVMCCYPGTQKPFLRAINMGVKPGGLVAMVGPAGSGKSSLMRLCCGLQQPNLGRITLDGAKINQWQPDEIGRHIGYYTPSQKILPGTVRENICRFSKDDEATLKASKLAGIHERILSWPQGYDSVIGKDLTPSDAEIQRLLLARALYQEPALLLLDEADSLQGPDGEKIILQILKNRKQQQQTTLICTNKTSALGQCDQIVIMKNGTIDEISSPHKLAQQEQEQLARKTANAS